MPSWDAVLQEIRATQTDGSSVDLVRRKYLKALNKKTGRNVIAYYSGWLSSDPNSPNLDIGDDDINHLMSVIHGLDCSVGLDLILHTPGGSITATEAIVNYLYEKFGYNITVIVPQLAMSAGTMIACAAKSIIMGKQSCLGPIDPQFGGIAAQAALDEFNMAHQEILQDPSRFSLWSLIIGKYHPTFLIECIQAIDLSRSIVEKWLSDNMFSSNANKNKIIMQIVSSLSDHRQTKTHSRHISRDKCKSLGLIIEDLEKDQTLQDIVLTIHHAFMHTFYQTNAIKIVENHKGVSATLVKR